MFLRRNEIANENYFSPKSFGKKEKTTLAYQFELKNNNSFSVIFLLMDQLSISQTKSAEVETEETSNGLVNSETGNISWTFNLNGGEKAERKLIYAIQTSGKYSYSRRKFTKKYKTISCPAF